MHVELDIAGMTCNHCQSAVTQALKSVEGVVSATVDLKAGKAVVEGDVEPSRLIAAVVEEGYTAQVVSTR